MDHSQASPARAVGLHPIHVTLAAFPMVCFTLTLASDVTYWQTSHLMWLNFSSWLLFAGLLIGGLAVVAGLADAVFSRVGRARASAFVHVVGNIIVLGTAFVNSLVHARDGWTAVVPTGLALSALTVFLMILTAILARAAAGRRHAGGVRHA